MPSSTAKKYRSSPKLAAESKAEKLKQAKKQARIDRIQTNQAQTCRLCQHVSENSTANMALKTEKTATGEAKTGTKWLHPNILPLARRQSNVR